MFLADISKTHCDRNSLAVINNIKVVNCDSGEVHFLETGTTNVFNFRGCHDKNCKTLSLKNLIE